MKFRHKITLSLLLTIVLCGVAFAQVVEIPDPNLRVAIREALNLPVGASVTRAGMQQLTRLDAANRQVKNLTGLEHATSLTYLALQNNDISDLRALTPLVNLTFLRLHGNQINDISPLANLTELTTLPLDSNDITNIGPLANLNKLTALALGDNNISDISPLANLMGLMHLVLSNNNITDVSPLANLANLKHLELQNNRITDITPLESLTNLDYLDTQNNPIFDADSPVVNIPDPNLRAAIRESLRLREDIPVTRAVMRQLTGLDAGGLGISDLTGLEHATSLTFLALHNNDISDLRALFPLVNLTFLRLHGNQINDLSPLANLTELTTLLLSANNITNLSPLANLTQLTTLVLDGNNITDISPLANLINLEWLEVGENQIVDHSPVNNLSIATFIYDETCSIPPLPLQPRLENRTFPSLFAAWGGPGWIRTLNRPDLSDIENLATHDLWFSTPQFETYFRETSDTIQMFASRGLSHAIESRDAFLAHNPNMVFLVQLPFRAAWPHEYPPDCPYWLRDTSGNLVDAGVGDAFLDFTHPGFQDRMVAQAVAVSECGLYDGILIDWWNDKGPVLFTNNPYVEYRGHEVEMQAKISIMERIRAETRPDFLILGNVNLDKLPRTGRYVNGGSMETRLPGDAQPDDIEKGLRMIERNLSWLEENLREPRINNLAAVAVPTEPPDSPTNLRWMRFFTTLSLTHSDGYILFTKGPDSNHHYWYDFWGADLGRPVGEKRQFYDEKIPGLYIREFTNGWAVYNHSGAAQVITLPEEAQGVASGLAGTEHELPNLDGEMYLRKEVVSDQSPVTSKNPADVNGDGMINILDLVLVAQGLGTDDSTTDVNGDGVVNVFDLVFVAGELQ